MKEQLKAAIKAAHAELELAQVALEDFEKLAENNVYSSLWDAGVLRGVLEGRAFEDCEGSYCCGFDVYEQEFMIGNVVHIATLEVEYNRHDKTYYYVDSSEFKIEVKA